MSINVFFIVLLAAALHAAWNAVVKAAPDKMLTAILITTAAAVFAAFALPFISPPDATSWPFIGVSVVLQIVYFILVARTYQLTDMGLTYPLMRGTAPLLVALAGLLVLGERLPFGAWVGVSMICAGIVGTTVGKWNGDGKGIQLALLNAVIIACYTLVDGEGVRRSGAAAGYTLWIFLLSGIVLALWGVATRRRELQRYVARYWHFGLIGGVGTVLSYGLALWAMTLAPVAVVAALREISIVFGALLAVVFLGERMERARTVAVLGIALGAAMLRLG